METENEGNDPRMKPVTALVPLASKSVKGDKVCYSSTPYGNYDASHLASSLMDQQGFGLTVGSMLFWSNMFIGITEQ